MQGGAFPHAEEAERARGRQQFRIETLAIIADAQGQPVAIGLDRHLQDGCIRVTNDVGEDFLEDAEDGQGRLRGQTSVAGESPAAATNSGAGFEFLELSVEGRRKPEIFENSGAQFSGDPADCLHGQVDPADNRGDALVEFTPRFSPAGAKLRYQGFEIEFQRREHLAELVVDFP
jgi:hypothetical protein